jgi:hypothetical protein
MKLGINAQRFTGLYSDNNFDLKMNYKAAMKVHMIRQLQIRSFSEDEFR